MDRRTIAIDPSATRLRRVGRLARRRMRIDGARLVNGLHTDGTLKVEIRGLGSPVAGVPDSFEWEADRPIAFVWQLDRPMPMDLFTVASVTAG